MFICEILGKFQKSELGKIIPNFPLKHVTPSTNIIIQKYLVISAIASVKHERMQSFCVFFKRIYLL